MRRLSRLFAFLLLFAVVGGASPVAAQDARWTTVPVADGTRFETAAYIQETGVPGPTVVIVGGLHGDEPAGAYAAGQLRHWPLQRGRLVVMPRGNVVALNAGKRLTPGAPKSLANANRNFPRATEAADAPARGEVAVAIWALVRAERPDWVLDLHEGFDIHQRNPKSVGRSIIAAPDATTDRVVVRMLEAVNTTITKDSEHFVRLERPVDGSLARATATHLGARSMIVETSTKGLAVSTRTRQHRVLVHRFLTEVRMLARGVRPQDVGFREGRRASTVIGVYDGGGASGRGVPNLLRQLPELDRASVVRIGPTDIRAGGLAQLDVVVFAGGMGGRQSRYLGAAGREQVRRFVEEGGGYVGICAGSYLACRGFSWGLGILDARTKSPVWRRGKGTVQMQMTAAGCNVLAHGEEPVGVLYANGPILAPAEDDGIPDFEALAVYRTEVAQGDAPAGIMVGSPAVVRGRFGNGRVVCFGPHPEQTPGLDDLVRRAVVWAAGSDAVPPKQAPR